MIDDRDEYKKTRAWLKPNKLSMITQIIGYLMTIDMSLLPLANLMVHLLRLSKRVTNITTVMGSFISSMM